MKIRFINIFILPLSMLSIGKEINAKSNILDNSYQNSSHISLKLHNISPYISSPIYHEWLSPKDVTNLWTGYNLSSEDKNLFIRNDKICSFFSSIKKIITDLWIICCPCYGNKTSYDSMPADSINNQEARSFLNSMKTSPQQTLKLDDYKGIKDAGFRSTFSKYTKLRKLSLVGCTNIKNARFINYVQHNPTLEDVDISHCNNLEDKAICELAMYCKNLKILNISHRSCVANITPAAIQALAKYCPYLEVLDLSHFSFYYDGDDYNFYMKNSRLS
jgi:hypothetical protein